MLFRSLVNFAGDLVVPLINKRGIKSDYKTANARQLQSVYNYQRVVLEAFTEVINRLNKVANYQRSVEIMKMQVERLVASVATANRLFQNAQTEYIDVLFAQRDLWNARADLIETKQAQLSAVINTYQALGGGWQHDPAVPELPDFAAAAHAPAMPAPAPNDPAKPGPQPGGANDLPPALP